MKKLTLKYRILVCVFPIVIFILLYAGAWIVLKYFTLPTCYFHSITGLYCPGCGNTRAVIALLKGDIFLSLRQNPTIIVVILTILLLYSEVVFKAFGVNYRSPARNYYYLYIVLVIMIAFYAVRNFVPQIAPI